MAARSTACGWHVQTCDGHDANWVDAAIQEAKWDLNKPSLIKLKTVIGFGAPNKSGTAGAHGAPLGTDELGAAKVVLGWKSAPFEIPNELAAIWHEAGRRGAADREAWERRFAAADPALRKEFDRRLKKELPEGYTAAVKAARDELFAAPQKVATRRASQMAIGVLAPVVGEMVGGSADLTHSNLTKAKGVDKQYTSTEPGRYVGFGVREFGMAAAMNGMCVHGGVIPFGGTFLVFSDYARNAIRLSALMEIGTIYVMTHDSIGLGEDGPTHQPIEHLASLRAIPNLQVFRPGDVVETLECWDIAVRGRKAPSLLALSRQDVPQLRLTAGDENLSAKGAYVIRSFGESRNITLIATGTEVSLAVEAAKALSADGIGVAVVSMPSWELFAKQPQGYRDEVLGSAPRIAVEAAGKFGWERFVGSAENVIGMDGFGASGPANELYAHFGITKEALKRSFTVMGMPSS